MRVDFGPLFPASNGEEGVRPCCDWPHSRRMAGGRPSIAPSFITSLSSPSPRLVSQVCVIAAAMTSRSPFVSPLEKREEANAAKASFAVARSDALAVLAAYRAWEVARAQVMTGRAD